MYITCSAVAICMTIFFHSLTHAFPHLFPRKTLQITVLIDHHSEIIQLFFHVQQCVFTCQFINNKYYVSYCFVHEVEMTCEAEMTVSVQINV